MGLKIVVASAKAPGFFCAKKTRHPLQGTGPTIPSMDDNNYKSKESAA
jgi:hypothetical protein